MTSISGEKRTIYCNPPQISNACRLSAGPGLSSRGGTCKVKRMSKRSEEIKYFSICTRKCVSLATRSLAPVLESVTKFPACAVFSNPHSSRRCISNSLRLWPSPLWPSLILRGLPYNNGRRVPMARFQHTTLLPDRMLSASRRLQLCLRQLRRPETGPAMFRAMAMALTTPPIFWMRCILVMTVATSSSPREPTT